MSVNPRIKVPATWDKKKNIVVRVRHGRIEVMQDFSIFATDSKLDEVFICVSDTQQELITQFLEDWLAWRLS